MKSSAINVGNRVNNIDEIFMEIQKLSNYAELDHKQSLSLRLLAEELVGMLKELSGNYEGQFWCEVEGQNIELITSIYVIDEMDNKTKKSFINVSSQKKNAAAKGVMGKIRDVVENMMYPDEAAYSCRYITPQLGIDIAFDSERQNNDEQDAENIVDNLMLSGSWSLNQYKAIQRNNKEPWDEIEKSIIANIADDVTVSVKGKDVVIKLTKSFE